MAGSVLVLSSQQIEVTLMAYFERPAPWRPTLVVALITIAPKMFQPMGFAVYQMAFSATWSHAHKHHVTLLLKW